MTEELKQLYTYNPVGKIQLDTLEISHSQFTQTFYMVLGNEPQTLNGQVYQPSGFKFSLPEKGGNQQDLDITLDNTDSTIIEELERATIDSTEAIQVIYRSFISDQPDTVQFELQLELQEITADAYSVTGRATNTNLYDKKFPRARFDSWRFKGLTL